MEEKDEIKEEKNEEFFKINNTINKLNKIYENFLKDYKKSNKNVDMIVNLLNNNGIFHPDLKEITKKYFENNKYNDEENIKNSNEISSNPNETQNREENKFINDEENNKIPNEISSIPKENQNKEENKNKENIINFKEENFYYFLLFIGTLTYEKKKKEEENKF